MEQLEYKVISLSISGEVNFNNVENVLNSFAKDGWEIVGTMGGGAGGVIFLKRRKQG